ncbi:hypothetical protein COR50_11765 [Chitinophaga caeni]|uniref:FecR protein domain-containing protein n=1 Tax=Chitinophaga caeni TaxID=2029983 RepID=A0A291QV25_9BACT|nr:FecR family protein [Chitinophaga caeni]ATL47787.1 hypothetical protein COR50_11765 [Chitinophaga caeni]
MKQRKQNKVPGDQEAQQLAKLAQQLDEDSAHLDNLLSEDEWKQFLVNGHEAHSDQSQFDPVYNASIRKTKRQKNLYTGIKYTAMVALLLVGTLFFMNRSRRAALPDTTATDFASFHHKNISSGVEKITLPDNSSIILYPNSEFSYAGNYNKNERHIQLIGKAVFDVTKDDAQPFTVLCRSIATTALGTKFEVDGYRDLPFVHLYEGKIIIRAIGDSTLYKYVKPGESFAYLETEKQFIAVPYELQTIAKRRQAAHNRKESSPATRHAPAAIVTDVKGHKTYINFQNKNLNEIFDYLAEKYDVEIRYPTDIVVSTNMLLSIDAAQSIDKIIENICSANGLKYKQVDTHKYIISK